MVLVGVILIVVFVEVALDVFVEVALNVVVLAVAASSSHVKAH